MRSLTVCLPVPDCPWCPRALRHPPCFEAHQNELTCGENQGEEGTQRDFSPTMGCPCLQKEPRLQRQGLPTEDHEGGDLRVWATLGSTKVNTRTQYNGPWKGGGREGGQPILPSAPIRGAQISGLAP